MSDKTIKISEKALSKAGELAGIYDISQKRILELAIEKLAEQAESGKLTLTAINKVKESRPGYKTKDK